ncbi:MAG: thiamine-phosphate kinase, partial [Planctomycetota bacterium]
GVGGAIIEASALPRRGGCDWRQAVGDGEDYELLFTASAAAALPTAIDGLAIARIGAVVAEQGVMIRHADGRTEAIDAMGWEHGR